MGFILKNNEELVARLLRKQIIELNNVLREVENNRALKDHALENLKHVELQIRWLRKICMQN